MEVFQPWALLCRTVRMWSGFILTIYWKNVACVLAKIQFALTTVEHYGLQSYWPSCISRSGCPTPYSSQPWHVLVSGGSCPFVHWSLTVLFRSDSNYKRICLPFWQPLFSPTDELRMFGAHLIKCKLSECTILISWMQMQEVNLFNCLEMDVYKTKRKTSVLILLVPLYTCK